MSKEQHNEITNKTELIFTGETSEFYTKGKKYKVFSSDACYMLSSDIECEGGHEWDENILDSFNIAQKEQDAQIFTRQMCDEGFLPRSGMKLNLSFIHGHTHMNSTITYMGDGVGCFKKKCGKEFSFSLDSVTFDYIDSRTDKEKIEETIGNLIDELFNDKDIRTIAKTLTNLITSDQASKIHNVFKHVNFTGTK